MEKCCKRCNVTKDAEDFNIYNDSADGRQPKCRLCEKEVNFIARRTKKGLVTTLFSNHRNAVRSGRVSELTYSKEDLRAWLYSQEAFHVLYDNWKRLDFQKAYAPSVDRIDDYLGYTLANIQLTTFMDNVLKGAADKASGKTLKAHVPTYQYTMDGEFVASYTSRKKAMESTGISDTSISRACSGKLPHAGYFIWKNKKDIS